MLKDKEIDSDVLIFTNYYQTKSIVRIHLVNLLEIIAIAKYTVRYENKIRLRFLCFLFYAPFDLPASPGI
jgi:hypothetical protein